MPNACRQRREQGTGSRALAALAILLALVLAGRVLGPRTQWDRTGGATERPTAPSAPPRHRAAERQRGATLFGSNVWQDARRDRRTRPLARIDATYGPVPIARVFSAVDAALLAGPASELGHRAARRVLPSPAVQGPGGGVRRASWPRGSLPPLATATPTGPSTTSPRTRPSAARSPPRHSATHGPTSPRSPTRSDNPRLQRHPHLDVLDGWRTVRARLARLRPRRRAVDVLAWDCYAKGTTPRRTPTPRRSWSRRARRPPSVGADWAIGELGARVMAGRRRPRPCRVADPGRSVRARRTMPGSWPTSTHRSGEPSGSPTSRRSHAWAAWLTDKGPGPGAS